MNLHSFAAVLLRVLGVWLTLEGTFHLAELSLREASGMAELYLHDRYYVVSHAAASFLLPELKLLLGIVLTFAAHFFARWICLGIKPLER